MKIEKQRHTCKKLFVFYLCGQNRFPKLKIRYQNLAEVYLDGETYKHGRQQGARRGECPRPLWNLEGK